MEDQIVTENSIDICEIDNEMYSETKAILKAKFSTIVDEYIEDSSKYIENIKQSVISKNAIIVAENAHPLKSSSYSFGLNGLGKVAEIIEHTAKNSLDDSWVEEVSDLLPKIDAAFEFVCERIKSL
ncbi:hypothetical protein AB835_07980 [Candidatus Endobugula sertula]|uniref:HPt domain-containing protein n=1 Tax=Candidatus Endobugula sertula TaxID=62101 RepID=A0A1D2QPZ4_9GAMM|nr:hypothetical protein AB835_07980 [Candidatus Endobugula sertula]